MRLNVLPDESRAFPKYRRIRCRLSLMLLLLAQDDVEVRRLASQVAALFPDPFVLPNSLLEPWKASIHASATLILD